MENVRIAILDSYEHVLDFMDNDAPDTLHYYDDVLHEYLQGSAYTYTFTCSADHDTSQFLIEGNHISFVYRGKDYFLNIMSTERNEHEITVEAYGLLFELLNEEKEKYSASSAMTFAQYMKVIDWEESVQIVLNEVTTSIRPLVECFTEEKGYPADLFIKNEEALLITNKNTLVMVVDTNRPSYTECPELLNRTDTICVFDHHRQNSEVIENPVLSYIEPYASSACEMIAEVLQYFSENIKLEPSEADCIYAGILIDTNNFMTKTGVRTFEAAAYLRRAGAEVTRVRKMLRNDMAAYKARAEAVRHAEVYRGAFAISVCPADNIESPTIVGAQAANELLNIVGIKASFVLTEYQGKIYISSRSIDEINVQLIMERVGGGGHLNVAGAQLTNCTIQEAKRMIQDTIDEMIKEGDIQE